jgi:two-component system, response regulator PdtaR
MFANNVEHVRIGKSPVKIARKAASKRTSGQTAQTTRVLIVEDEIFVAWHLEGLVRDLDYAVCGMVPDGEGAVSKAEALGADVILMDINLKGEIDGVEAARRIRETFDAPIIFITAYSDPKTLGRIEKTVPGATVLAKPVAAGRLRVAIANALRDAA